jgi:hypothetical protein
VTKRPHASAGSLDVSTASATLRASEELRLTTSEPPPLSPVVLVLVEVESRTEGELGLELVVSRPPSPHPARTAMIAIASEAAPA